MRGLVARSCVVGFSFWYAAISLGDEPITAPPPSVVSGELPEFARIVFQITELVLDHHIEPPTRQEMLLCGLTALYGDDVPSGLGRDVSAVANEDDFVSCLVSLWPAPDLADIREASRYRFLEGLGYAVPGGLHFKSAKQAAVDHQFAANRYVGIGVALAKADNANAYQFVQILPRGSAAKAGIAEQELLLEVDGVKMEDLTIEQLIDRLRGAEGTSVIVKVARAAASKPRVVTLIRSVVPMQTVVGHRKLGPEEWETVIDGDVRAAYLMIERIAGSTAAELREYEAELTAKHVNLLVLDLRRASCEELRHAVTLADALLDGGSAGKVRTRDGATSIPLERDCLFRDWRMAVLIDRFTANFGEWLASALQSQRKAIVVGKPTTGGRPFVLTPINLPDDRGVMQLATAILERQAAPSGNAAGPRPFPANVPPAEAVGLESLLFRLPSSTRERLDRRHGVLPDVEVRLGNELFQSPALSPGVSQSPIVLRAIEALKNPSKPKPQGVRDEAASTP